jgi:hypothetical protein
VCSAVLWVKARTGWRSGAPQSLSLSNKKAPGYVCHTFDTCASVWLEQSRERKYTLWVHEDAGGQATLDKIVAFYLDLADPFLTARVPFEECMAPADADYIEPRLKEREASH